MISFLSRLFSILKLNPDGKRMSDNIPFDIQMEIMKWLPVKSLVQFRSVSKTWKSFIDSSQFIQGYGARHTQPHSFILRYKLNYSSEEKYICLVEEDDIETFKVRQQQEFVVVSPLLKQYPAMCVLGASHGLLCLFCYDECNDKVILVIWNPCIGKSFGIAFGANDDSHLAFGVCPVTKDPMVVKILCGDGMPWHVEVFTLSSGVWNVIPSSKLPRQSIKLNPSTPVVIDRSIYWVAHETSTDNNGEYTTNYMVLSFDLVTKEFKVVNLLDTLASEISVPSDVSLCKLSGSLVVSAPILVEGAACCGVWVMEHDSSFRKIFTIRALFHKILEFRKNGEPILVIRQENGHFGTLNVYDPSSQQIKNLGISGARRSFYMGFYKESLLLLDHLDSHIFYGNDI